MTHEESRKRRELIAQFIKGGGEVGEACRKFKVGRGVIRHALDEHGVPVEWDHRVTFSNYGVVAALCNTDEPLVSLARRFGVSKQRLSQIYQECIAKGIPVRARPQGKKSKDAP